jgi:hypothetical protein
MIRIIIFILITLLIYSCTTNQDGTISTLPLPPTNLSGKIMNLKNINLSWTDNSTNETGFKIERKIGSGNYIEIGSVSADVTIFNDLNISPNTTYTYRVYSFNLLGKTLTYTNEITITTYDLSNGLIAYYPFNGNANDESGNLLNGNVNGAVLSTDRYGKSNSAYSFTTNQDITIPNTTNFNTYPLTVSLWYNAKNLADGEASNLFSKYIPAAWNGFQIVLADNRNVSNNGVIINDGFGVQSWYLKNINNKVIGYYGESSFLQKNISKDTWYHYVFVLDNSGGKIYVNGQLIDTHNWTGPYGACSNNYLWKIGGFYNTWFNGKIDDVAIWNRALSQNEIISLYNN